MPASSSTPATATRAPVVTRGLSRRFGDKLALAPLDLELRPGITGLLGPNGSGKSTLLRILVGLVRPTTGGATVAGIELEGDGTAVRRRCAYSPGEIALYGEFRAGDHLDWFLRGRDGEARERARRMAEDLGLPLNKRVHTYSHGMKRQLMFAAALAPRVPLRILDEPSDGLDPQKRGALVELLAEDAAAGTSILLSSHHLGEVDRVCRHFVFLNAGVLVTTEDAAEVRARAERLVQVDYGSALEDPGARAALEQALSPLAGVRTQLEGPRLVAELDSDDARPFLAAIGREGAPSPRSVRFGEVSLSELYRDLYGVEAC